MAKSKCDVCSETAKHLYTLPSNEKVCIRCFHGSWKNSAYDKLGVTVPKDQAARAKKFKGS